LSARASASTLVILDQAAIVALRDRIERMAVFL
jgi:hypothetical protein